MKKFASRILAGLLCALALPAAVLAQAAYPNRPIELGVANLGADSLIGFFCGDGPTNLASPEVLNGLAA
jgi:hypothetical protein